MTLTPGMRARQHRQRDTDIAKDLDHNAAVGHAMGLEDPAEVGEWMDQLRPGLLGLDGKNYCYDCRARAPRPVAFDFDDGTRCDACGQDISVAAHVAVRR